MVKNYLQVALRNLLKNKSYVLINVLGLSIALACCITAYLIVAYNFEFDTFHDKKKSANIFKIHADFQDKSGNNYTQNLAPMPMGPAMATEISGVENYMRYITSNGFMRFGDGNTFNQSIAFADSTIFELFDFPLRSGSKTSFKDKFTIFIAPKAVEKYFADTDPIGKQVTLYFQNDKEIEVIVGGVFEKIPENNSFYMDVLMRIENYMDIYDLEYGNWSDWRNPSTFLQLVNPQNASNINQQLARYEQKRNEVYKDVRVQSYQLAQFHSKFTWDDIYGSQTNMRIGSAPMIVFTSLAILILLIACFNLTNTSIAMTAKRLKEIGVRKSVGALRSQIVMQFLLETVLIMAISLFTGYFISKIMVPQFSAMWGIQYTMDDLSGLNFIITLIILVFLASLLAGIYPALFNSRFNSVALLKGGVQIKGTNALTRILLSLQFALSVIVLVAGVIFIQNTSYQESIGFGYEKDNLLVVFVQGEKEYQVMENEVLRLPAVEEVAGSRDHISWSNYQTPVGVDTGKYEVRAMAIGKNYLQTMGLTFLEGRSLNMDNATDHESMLVVNEAFLDRTGMTDPLEKEVELHGVKRRIAGVVSNHLDNLFRSKEEEPFVYYLCEPNQYQALIVKGAKSKLNDINEDLQKAWKENFPSKSFESKFHDEIVLGEIRTTNTNLEKIFIFLTVLGGLLSASGIFSLASLNIARRTKEIGIRKVLGATVGNVLRLINREFVIILIIAGLIGASGGFFLTDALLAEIYEYHVPVGIIPVILCALTIFLIGIFTTSLTILKAAGANPVDTLRSE